MNEARNLPSAATPAQPLAGLLAPGRLKLLPMIVVLLVVWAVLQGLTGGLFLSARNLTNLSGQVAITAMLTAGAVVAMVPRWQRPRFWRRWSAPTSASASGRRWRPRWASAC